MDIFGCNTQFCARGKIIEVFYFKQRIIVLIKKQIVNSSINPTFS